MTPTLRLAVIPAVLSLLLQGCIIVPIPVAVRSDDGSPRALVPVALPKGCTRPAAADAMQTRTLALVNAFRQQNGLPALRASARLATVAQAHACDNAARASIDHTGSDGSTLGQRLNRGGYRWWAAAENTGLGFVDSPDRMVVFWQNSPLHRANLLNTDVTEAGLGFTGGARPAWVLNLGQPR